MKTTPSGLKEGKSLQIVKDNASKRKSKCWKESTWMENAGIQLVQTTTKYGIQVKEKVF